MAVRISTEARSREDLLERLPAPAQVSAAAVAEAASRARRVVVLDDDPTGTQTVADVPIITSWEDDDVRWALAQSSPGFYVLTNTRSLSADAAASRNREVVAALARVAGPQFAELAIVSRSDSTLRGHFPLETDVLAEAHERRLGRPVDGIVIVPAYIDAGRITVDSMHWVGGPDGFRPVGETEFASDPAFGYAASDLRDYVAEKTQGRWPATEVERITLEQLRRGGVVPVRETLRELSGARPVVVDAAADEDLRVLALAAIEAEQLGSSFIYRVGPSFVRNRLGQQAHPPLSGDALAELCARTVPVGSPPLAGGGLVVAGSYVGLTTRQLERVAAEGGATQVTLDVPSLLAAADPAAVVASVADATVAALRRRDVVVQTSRRLVAAGGGADSLAASARVSDALVAIVAAVIREATPRWIVAKGGITSSDIATRALSIRRAWARGTLLPGIVSLWQPADAPAGAVPYIVFAGNVGDDGSLATVVQRLRAAG